MSERVRVWVERALLFGLSVAFAYSLTPLIRFTAANPYEIVNAQNLQDGWNPENNYIKVVFVVVASALIHWGLSVLRRRAEWAVRALAGVMFVISWLVPTLVGIASTTPDYFHYGEQLSPTRDFLERGKTFYDEIFTLHGIGVDELRPALSFALFSGGHPNIGAYLLGTTLWGGLTIALLAVLLALSIRSFVGFLTSVAFFAGAVFGGFTLDKTFLLLLALIAIWFALVRAIGVRRLVALGIASALGSLALFDSLDMGLVMVAICGSLAVGLVFVDLDEGAARFDRPRLRLSRWLPAIVIAGSAVVVQIIVAIILGWRSYRAFIANSFIEIPRFQGLTWDFPIPTIGQPDGVETWVPVIALGGVLAVLVALIRRLVITRVRVVSARMVYAAIIAVGALVYLRFAAGRPDVGHIIVSTWMVFFAAFLIIDAWSDLPLKPDRVADGRRARRAIVAWVGALVLMFGVAWPQQLFQPTTILAAGNADLTVLKQGLTVASRPDSSWMSPDQAAVVAEMDRVAGTDRRAFVFAYYALYTYLSDLENPTRFYLPWFADPTPWEQEVLHDLKADPPPVVVIDKGQPAIYDGFSLASRMPAVQKWIDQNYVVDKEFDSVDVMRRR